MGQVTAPEKIYISTNSQDGTYYISNQYKRLIEYTRTDTFIEKTREWIRNNSHNYANNALGKEYLVNDFVAYMKGE